MKTELTIKKQFDVKYLLAEIGARYWEDTEVDGVEDVNGDLIPCRDGEYWKPLIDIESGIILNWEKGKTAKVHYKSCDDNLFKLLDKNKEVIATKEGYTINMVCPDEEGYGDYVIMTINEDGLIKDFKAEFTEFGANEDED